MRTEHLGPDELLVAAKIELLDGLEVAEVTEIVNRVEASIRRAVPTARVIFLEPDIYLNTLPADLDPPQSNDEPEPESGEAVPAAADAELEPAADAD